MKILAQGSGSLDKMIREAALAAPNPVSRCLERLDAALFFELGKEAFGGVSSHGNRSELEHKVLTSGTGLCEVARRINSALSDVFRLKEGDSVFPSGDLAPYIRNFGERLSFASRYVPDKWPFDAWRGPECKGCCQEAMNPHYYAARFGKFGGSFSRKAVERISLVIEARLNGRDLALPSSALKPASPSSLGPLGKPYEDRMKHDIDTSEMSYGMRKPFSQIEHGVL